jgi:hypothetical protein
MWALPLVFRVFLNFMSHVLTYNSIVDLCRYVCHRLANLTRIGAYADLMSQRAIYHVNNQCLNRNTASTVIATGMSRTVSCKHGTDLTGHSPLPELSKARISNWVDEQRTLNEKLDKDTFVKDSP